MKRTFNKCAIFLAFVLACQCVSATHLVKRDDGSEGVLEKLKNMLSGLPVVGDLLSKVIEKGQNIYNKLQELTNGAVGRLLGGALPCTIGLDTGLTCTGVTTQSSLSDVVRGLLDPLPSIMLPGILKNLIYMGVDGFAVPIVDVLFGGVPMKQQSG